MGFYLTDSVADVASTSSPHRLKNAYPGFSGIRSGARFYDPKSGRWASKDPIEESGGINLYAWCGNDGVDRVDPVGLTWTVERSKSKSRADAWNDCGDTVDDLAKQIKLDPAEFPKWLQGLFMPTSSSEKIPKMRKFTVPNEIHMTQGVSDGLLQEGAKTIVDAIRDKFADYALSHKAEGYLVNNHAPYTLVGNSLNDIKIALASPDIAEWVHGGHGRDVVDQNDPSDEMGIVLGTPPRGHSPARFKPHHKLAGIHMYACYMGSARFIAGTGGGWRVLLSPNGTLDAPYSSIKW